MLSTLEKYKGRSYTSCPDINSWITAFGDSDIIFVITMTSGLSGTYNSATAAAKLYLESHPNAKIKDFDTSVSEKAMRSIYTEVFLGG